HGRPSAASCDRPAACLRSPRWRTRCRNRTCRRAAASGHLLLIAPLPRAGEGNGGGAGRLPPLQHAAPHLVALDRLEQGLEVALAEALVALALDDLEEDRAEGVLGEDLQQQAALGLHVGVDQDLVPGQPRYVLAVVGNALVDDLEVGV